MTSPTPPCPKCRKTKPVRFIHGDLYCVDCKAFFDTDPDEGGDFSDRNPAARLEREERRKERKR